MKKIIFLIILFACGEIMAQEKKNTNSNYDKNLAERLEADDYGMKNYFMVILKTGHNNEASQEEISQSFRDHLDNINQLVEKGIIVLSGPLGKNDQDFRGIFILDKIKTLEEAKELLQTDSAIRIGLLDYDIFDWYGSAALSEYLSFANKIWKVKP